MCVCVLDEGGGWAVSVCVEGVSLSVRVGGRGMGGGIVCSCM